MPLSRETEAAIMRALSGVIMFREVMADSLTSASKADNAASAMMQVRMVRHDLALLQSRVDGAFEQIEKDLKSDEMRSANDAAMNDLMAALAPYKPRLVAVS